MRDRLAALALMLTAWTALVAGPAPAWAELQLNLYGGLNENLSSHVDVELGTVRDSRDVNWKGKSFALPPYWGARATWWLNSAPNWGLAIDYTHSKAYADIDFIRDPVYTHLEFTDGNNLLTANLLYRFQSERRLVPYLGLGVGVAIPHVEVILDRYDDRPTWRYKLTGVAAQALAGVEYRLSEQWSVFAEGRISYSQINAHLTAGGNLSTELWSPHLALGLSWRLWRPDEPMK